MNTSREIAIANKVVDASTASTAFTAGAVGPTRFAVGAMVGSVVPVAGTAVGAVEGFGVGVGRITPYSFLIQPQGLPGQPKMH